MIEFLNSNAPAIQAVGTIVALLIAIGVPTLIHCNEQRERRRQELRRAQALCILIDPILRTLDGEIERQSIFRQEGLQAIEIPEDLIKFSGEFWLLGEAGGHILQLIGLLQAHARMVSNQISIPIDLNEHERDALSHSFHERIKLARECIASALSRFESILDD